MSLCVSRPSFACVRTFRRLFSTTKIDNNDPIHRVDLRVGKIVSVEKHPQADHLYIEQGKLHTSDI